MKLRAYLAAGLTATIATSVACLPPTGYVANGISQIESSQTQGGIDKILEARANVIGDYSRVRMSYLDWNADGKNDLALTYWKKEDNDVYVTEVIDIASGRVMERSEKNRNVHLVDWSELGDRVYKMTSTGVSEKEVLQVLDELAPFTTNSSHYTTQMPHVHVQGNNAEYGLNFDELWANVF